MAQKNASNWSPYTARRKAKPGSGAPTQRGRHRRPEKIFSFNEADDRIYDVFRNHGFADYPHEKRHQLVQFYQLLMKQQQKENFTRLTKIKDIALKHFVDCLMLPQLADFQFPLLDLGTGPGFPGVPLKIDFPTEKILLAEGVQKRVNFLKHVREELELKDLQIIGRNIDEEFVYPVQSVITRAVEDMSNTLKNIKNAVQTGGVVYFMKGPNCGPEIEAAKSQWDGIYQLEKNIDYELPNTDQQRRLVSFRKIRSDEN